MYRRNRIALMVGLVSLLLVAVFLFSSCVAADGTVYGLQPVTANMMAANKQFILDYFTCAESGQVAATVDKYVADEVLKHHIDPLKRPSPAISSRQKR
ncbi:MAG: hypothetical protein R2867_31015 [Caldilineaceae bacterium]